MSPSPEIIVYSYPTAPNPQKLFQFLALYALPYKYVEISSIMPRPQLAEIGVTYRRTPLLSIGSDMYIDNALIISKLADMAQHSDTGLDDNTNHLEYDGLGQLSFQLAVGLMPADSPVFTDKAFMADRAELLGRPMNPEAMLKARPQTMSKFISLVQLVERNFLRNGERKFFLGGEKPTSADMHLYWGLNSAICNHKGARPEISECTHPTIMAWLNAVDSFIKERSFQTKIDISEAKRILLEPPKHEYAKFVPHVEENQEGLKQGQRIKVTPVDHGKSGPQFGSLISLNYEQVCLRNDKGLVIHFPRLGYEVVSAGEGGKL